MKKPDYRSRTALLQALCAVFFGATAALQMSSGNYALGSLYIFLVALELFMLRWTIMAIKESKKE